MHPQKLIPIIYTPNIGLVCKNFSLIYNYPSKGLYLNILEHFGQIERIFNSDYFNDKQIKAIVVTDGERILGLGDLGANGMAISIGKIMLYSAIGGIPPVHTFPICLDIGTNNRKLLEDTHYIGLREKRVTGEKYDQFIDELMEAVRKRWGQTCLVQFEDFSNANAIRLLNRYKQTHCMFNDDIQGTAAVIVAGLLSAFRLIERPINEHRFLFFGAGNASLGIANLLVMSMIEHGIDSDEANDKIWLIDSDGLITKNRIRKQNINDDNDFNDMEYKRIFAKNVPDSNNLLEIINISSPTCLIGASTVKGAFDEKILTRMSELNEHPIIFALSNPNSKSECTAYEAIHYTNGKCIFVGGSPFKPIKYNDQLISFGQGNNIYIFPAIALATISCKVHHIVDDIFLIASKALNEYTIEYVQKSYQSNNEQQQNFNQYIYPSIEHINQVSLFIATKLTEWLYRNGMANYWPEPDDKMKFLQQKLYSTKF